MSRQMSMPMISAPSLASRSACERPWPRAMPEMKATLPSSVPMYCLFSDDCDALDLEELLQTCPAAFLAEAAQPDTAKWPVHTQVHRPVDQHLAGHELVGDPVRAAQVRGLDVSRQPVRRAVRDLDRLVLGAEWGDRQDRPED